MQGQHKAAGTVMAALFLAACAPTPDTLEKALQNNPELLQQAVARHLAEHPEAVFAAIEQDPEGFIAAAANAQREQQKLAQQRQLDEAFANPRDPAVEADRVIFGNPDAPVTIVGYSDFECPYCGRVNPTLQKLMADYGDQLRLVYKHLPLSFHKLAVPAARYFEAIGLQDPAKAKAFHDALFADQKALSQGGEDYLRQTAEGLGVDMARLATDLESEQVAERIAADTAEAQQFGIRGTPGFLINGVPLSGAKPYAEFKVIIDRHLSAG